MLMRLALSKAPLSCQLLAKSSKLNPSLFRNYARGPVRPPRNPVIVERAPVRSQPTLKEKLMGPPSENAFSLGKGAAAGAAAVGLGALCYYGIGMGKHTSIADNAIMWPQYVKERIQSTYAFFGGSCLLTAASAAAVFRSPRLLSLASRGGFVVRSRRCYNTTVWKRSKTKGTTAATAAAAAAAETKIAQKGKVEDKVETDDSLSLEMERRYLKNPFADFAGGENTPFATDEEHIKTLICTYVDAILEHCHPNSDEEDNRGDLYVGNAGIAYMFWKLNSNEQTRDLYPALEHAAAFIRNAKVNAQRYKKRSAERYSFLCGNAGIYAVSAAISQETKNTEELSMDLANFKSGIPSSKEFMHTKYGCDEMLVGRAGYLSGCYWLNDVLPEKKITDDDLISICQLIIHSGREYSKLNNSPLPLMYQYHGTEYLGAAHGLCSILHMLLDSPWFRTVPISAPAAELRDIKRSIDFLLELQDGEGNFPVAMEDLRSGRDKRLVHWCHGAPGAVYVIAKAYLIFKEDKYIISLRRAADLVWKKGFLRKGPGICHGVAGNGYVFLLLFRLTNEMKYLYRAHKFMELLTNAEFKQRARVPDRPHSLYEGVAGTVCFLVDLLEPEQAYFPFMDVFH
ncbi:lanC-like protein 3 homolog isoform X2 [Drosophila navojoa]|uniref:lanC-like protein 3 homolog isoform X2 n=1 Tax=Drosophila navojoa TaxID=7232 RepID=UPI0011BDFA9A|nr:lanC-like protein 3 homolog isoform X2 [Drosophila navojoa]